jgi:hypothetical protein
MAAGLRRDHDVASYLDAFRPGLEDIPSALFVVGSSRNCQRALRRTATRYRWQPLATASFPRIDATQIATFSDTLVSTLVH